RRPRARPTDPPRHRRTRPPVLHALSILRRLLPVVLAFALAGPLAAQGAPELAWLGGGHIGMTSAALSPDGLTFGSAGQDDETVKLWRTSDGALLHTLASHLETVNGIAFSPDGLTLASCGGVAFGSGDVNVKLWRVSDGALLKTFDNGDFSTAWSVA